MLGDFGLQLFGARGVEFEAVDPTVFAFLFRFGYSAILYGITLSVNVKVFIKYNSHSYVCKGAAFYTSFNNTVA